MNPRIGVSTFANRYKPNPQTKVCKRASTFPAKENLFFKIPPLQIFLKPPTHKPDNDIENLIKPDFQDTDDRTPAGNK